MNNTAIKVLLIEDNPSDAKAILRILHTSQWTTSVLVESANRLSQALEHLQKNKVDIILADLGLPDSTGRATLTRLLEQSPDVPIVVMTGAFMDEELAIDAVHHGAQDYLFKDTLGGELLMRVIQFSILRNRIDVQRKYMTLELKRSNDDLMQFAHTAAHDLKSPLHNITGFIRILEDHIKGHTESDIAHDLVQITSAAKRMGTLIDNLLMYARAGSGGLNIQQISIENALQSALKNLHKAIEESGAVITHNPLPRLLCDGTHVVSLLQNLIDNAIKFRGGKVPHVEIRAEALGDALVFSVCDNGIGIDPKYHDKIFDAFERLHSQSEYLGSGIGLAACKKIVERHGGRLWVISHLGEGATFHFTLSKREKP